MIVQFYPRPPVVIERLPSIKTPHYNLTAQKCAKQFPRAFSTGFYDCIDETSDKLYNYSKERSDTFEGRNQKAKVGASDR